MKAQLLPLLGLVPALPVWSAACLQPLLLRSQPSIPCCPPCPYLAPLYSPMQAGYILPCSAKPTSDCVVEANSDWGVHTIEKW